MKKLITLIFTVALVLGTDLLISELDASRTAYAQNKKKAAAKKSSGPRKRIVVQEAKVKGNKRDKTKVNFDEATLEGRRLNPSGVSLNLQKPNKEFDLIKLRRHWKPEMVSSTTSLENL